MELDHKLIESTEDGDLMLALDADALLRKSHTQNTTRTRDREFKQHILNKTSAKTSCAHVSCLDRG